VTIERYFGRDCRRDADEYDDEAALFRPIGKGAWVIESRMNLLDLDEELDIKIHKKVNDTIAGYISSPWHIPQKGVLSTTMSLN